VKIEAPDILTYDCGNLKSICAFQATYEPSQGETVVVRVGEIFSFKKSDSQLLVLAIYVYKVSRKYVRALSRIFRAYLRTFSIGLSFLAWRYKGKVLVGARSLARS
jgi:hypothetical protein